MKFKLIIACDQKGGIAKDGKLPWDYPEDLRYFKEVTMGGAIIMGRKTLESIGKCLPGRKTFVFTTQREAVKAKFPEAIPVASIQELELELSAEGFDTAWVCGGKEIYEMFIAKQLVEEMHISKIQAEFPCDVYMSTSEFKTQPDPNDWDIVSRNARHFVGRPSLGLTVYKRK